MTKSHLSIELSNQSARFTVIDNESISNSLSVVLDEFKEQEKKDKLKSTFENTAFLKSDFDEITLSWSSSRTTIVPNNIFAESGPKELFNLCFSKGDSNREIDYNRIAEYSVVNLYDIQTWIKSFFVIRYPRIIIQSEGSHLIREIIINSYKLKVFLSIHEDYFLLAIAQKNELEFYSSFDFQSYEDILYHLVFVLQQKEMVNVKGELRIINGVGSNSDLMDEIEINLSKIADLNDLSVSVSNDQVAKSQMLCV